MNEFEPLHLLCPEPQMTDELAISLVKRDAYCAEAAWNSALAAKKENADALRKEFSAKSKAISEMIALPVGERCEALETADMAELRKSINKDIAAVLKEREEIGSQLAIIDGASLADFTPELLHKAQAAGPRMVQLMGQEMQVRSRIKTEWQSAVLRARGSLAIKVEAIRDDFKNQLTRQLCEIGYYDGPLPGMNALSIIPDFYFRHPEMRFWKGEAESAHIHRQVSPLFDQNAKSMDRLGKEIQLLMRKIKAKHSL